MYTLTGLKGAMVKIIVNAYQFSYTYLLICYIYAVKIRRSLLIFPIDKRLVSYAMIKYKGTIYYFG